jgi:plasmid stabilization system protein ParE
VRQLRVRKTARAEIAAAFDWYLDRSPAAAARFLEAVDEAMRLIEEAPERHPIIRGRLRRVLLRQFPYGVYCKIYPTTISVVGVIHGHRHPETWLRRATP